MKRIIQKNLVNALSEKILAGEMGEGDTISAEVGKDGVIRFIPILKGKVVQ